MQPDAQDLEIRIIGDPVLRKRAAAVTSFGAPLKELADRMYDTMADAVGIGLAAPQIGLSMRFLVVGIPEEDTEELTLMAFANPRILEQEGRCVMEEGCLSIPEIREDVERPARIRLAWQDLDGAAQEAWFEDLEARVILHEMDHLDGVLFTDRISPARKATLKRRLEQVAQRGHL